MSSKKIAQHAHFKETSPLRLREYFHLGFGALLLQDHGIIIITTQFQIAPTFISLIYPSFIPPRAYGYY